MTVPGSAEHGPATAIVSGFTVSLQVQPLSRDRSVKGARRHSAGSGLWRSGGTGVTRLVGDLRQHRSQHTDSTAADVMWSQWCCSRLVCVVLAQLHAECIN